MLDHFGNAQPKDYMKQYWTPFKKTLEENKLDTKLEEMTKLQAKFMEENPKKITRNQKFPRLEPKLEEENLVNAGMVGATDKKAHKYSFIHQGKAVSFLNTKIFVKDVNNLIDSKKSYV